MHGGSWGRSGRAGPTGLCVCGCPAPGPAGRRARARLSCEQSSTHLHIRVIMMAAAVGADAGAWACTSPALANAERNTPATPRGGGVAPEVGRARAAGPTRTPLAVGRNASVD